MYVSSRVPERNSIETYMYRVYQTFRQLHIQCCFYLLALSIARNLAKDGSGGECFIFDAVIIISLA